MTQIISSKALLLGIVLLAQLIVGQVAAQNASGLVPVAAPIPSGLETVEFYSPAVDRRMKFDIVLPEGYYQSDAQYPVLYLLHGYMQNYTVWGRNLAAAFYARELNDLIVVLPDAGNSWFINYASSIQGQTNNWEDYIVNDVIGQVDKRYRTEPRREGRAIAGLSMGGFGAYSMGLRNSELFVSIGSTSGALGHARAAAAAIRAGANREHPPRQIRSVKPGSMRQMLLSQRLSMCRVLARRASAHRRESISQQLSRPRPTTLLRLSMRFPEARCRTSIWILEPKMA